MTCYFSTLATEAHCALWNVDTLLVDFALEEDFRQLKRASSQREDHTIIQILSPSWISWLPSFYPLTQNDWILLSHQDIGSASNSLPTMALLNVRGAVELAEQFLVSQLKGTSSHPYSDSSHFSPMAVSLILLKTHIHSAIADRIRIIIQETTYNKFFSNNAQLNLKTQINTDWLFQGLQGEISFWEK